MALTSLLVLGFEVPMLPTSALYSHTRLRRRDRKPRDVMGILAPINTAGGVEPEAARSALAVPPAVRASREKNKGPALLHGRVAWPLISTSSQQNDSLLLKA